MVTVTVYTRFSPPRSVNGIQHTTNHLVFKILCEVYFLEEGVTSFIIVSIQSMTSAPQTTDLKASTLLYLPYCLNNWQINRWQCCF